MAPIWIVTVVFVATGGLCYFVADRAGRRQRRVYARLNQLQWERFLPPAALPEEATVAERSRELLPFVSQALERHGLGERLKWLLAQAGLSLRPYEFVLGTMAAAVIGFLVGLQQRNGALAVLLALAGAAAPLIAVRLRRSQRLAQFNDQLADALTRIASAIRAGHSFLRAVEVTASQFPDPMKQEFERAVEEAKIGYAVPVALQNMLRRVPSYDLELAATAIAIQSQVGGNLSEILDTIAETIRDRVRNRRQIAVLTAEGKMSGWIGFFAPWVLFVFLYFGNPTYMQPFVRTPMGQVLLGGTLLLQLAGGFWIRRLLAIDL